MARRPFAVFLLLIVLSASPQSSAQLRAEPTSIRPEALRAHVGFLADDLLEGRFAGTRGYDLAARYVAAQLEAAGIEPAGVDGYLQPVPLRQTELLREEATASLLGPQGEVPLALEEHYLLTPNPFRERFALEAPVVFVGYGIVAPERGTTTIRESTSQVATCWPSPGRRLPLATPSAPITAPAAPSSLSPSSGEPEASSSCAPQRTWKGCRGSARCAATASPG